MPRGDEARKNKRRSVFVWNGDEVCRTASRQSPKNQPSGAASTSAVRGSGVSGRCGAPACRRCPCAPSAARRPAALHRGPSVEIESEIECVQLGKAETQLPARIAFFFLSLHHQSKSTPTNFFPATTQRPLPAFTPTPKSLLPFLPAFKASYLDESGGAQQHRFHNRRQIGHGSAGLCCPLLADNQLRQLLEEDCEVVGFCLLAISDSECRIASKGDDARCEKEQRS